MPKFYLASSSPARKKLLDQIGLEFKVINPDYEEDMGLMMEPQELAKHLAEGKARAASRQLRSGLVIAADTIAVLGRNVLGKPMDDEHAQIMLKSLSGRTIDSITGVAVIDAENGKLISRASLTKVTFRELSEEEIDAYVQSGEATGKAGAFGIQGKGALLIEKIEGDYNTIVGLPLVTVYGILKEFGIELL